jgi:WD40 repeat protein
MIYNPSQNMLAVGSHDNYIYLYTVKANAYTKYAGPLKGHSSYICCLDWSSDGSYIRSNCGAYELLFFNVANKK